LNKRHPESENWIRCRVEKLMAAFEVARFSHRSCVDKIHYVVFFDGYLLVLHSDQLDECDGDVLLSTIEISGGNISKSQRETLRERLITCLRRES